MSHFTVMVLTKPNGKSVEKLLAPYDENISVAPYINRTKEKMIADGKANKERYLKWISEGKDVSNMDWIPKYLEAKTDEEFYLLERDYEDDCYDEYGNELTTYNPNSKWDWYQIGGRWSGLFDGKDSVLISDLNFEIDKEKYNKNIRFWEVVVDEDKIREDENERDFDNWYSKEWYVDTYHDKETYAKCNSVPSTYAVVTPDGVWHEEGQMGWFGMSSETPDEALDWELHFKERFIDTAELDWTATLIDCHI